MTQTKKKTKNIYHKLIEIQKEAKLKNVSGKNTVHNYEYATIQDVVKSIKPLFIKHGLLVIPQENFHEYHPTDGGEKGLHIVNIKFEVIDPDTDESVSFSFYGAGEDKKGSRVGLPIAYTMARKEFFIMLANLEIGDDAEKDVNTKTDENKVEKVIKMIEKLKTKEQIEKAIENYEKKKEEYDEGEQMAIEAVFEAKLKEFEKSNDK